MPEWHPCLEFLDDVLPRRYGRPWSLWPPALLRHQADEVGLAAV